MECFDYVIVQSCPQGMFFKLSIACLTVKSRIEPRDHPIICPEKQTGSHFCCFPEWSTYFYPYVTILLCDAVSLNWILVRVKLCKANVERTLTSSDQAHIGANIATFSGREQSRHCFSDNSPSSNKQRMAERRQTPDMRVLITPRFQLWLTLFQKCHLRCAGREGCGDQVGASPTEDLGGAGRHEDQSLTWAACGGAAPAARGARCCRCGPWSSPSASSATSPSCLSSRQVGHG